MLRLLTTTSRFVRTLVLTNKINASRGGIDMGYYSDLAIEDSYREDYSYPSPETQLRWRIEDLQSRLEDIAATH